MSPSSIYRQRTKQTAQRAEVPRRETVFLGPSRGHALLPKWRRRLKVRLHMTECCRSQENAAAAKKGQWIQSPRGH